MSLNVLALKETCPEKFENHCSQQFGNVWCHLMSSVAIPVEIHWLGIYKWCKLCPGNMFMSHDFFSQTSQGQNLQTQPISVVNSITWSPFK